MFGRAFYPSTSSLILLLNIIVGTSSALAIEQPSYSVSEKHRFEGDTIEIRNYAPYLVAETTVETENFNEASSEGFKRLAAYIFGENNGNVEMDMTAPVETKRPEKMEMTAPVSSGGAPGAWVIRFMMPSRYTIETLPTPNDDRITIVEIPARTVAVLPFSGRWTLANFAEHTDRLQRFLARKKIARQGEPNVARYNMPLTPWFLRTNEIQIDIER